MRSSMKIRKDWRSEDRRREARYTLILRAGVLQQEGETSFCLVRNISAAGLQLKFYTRPILNADASLRVGDELPVKGCIAWIKQDTAGIRFYGELDTMTLLRVQQKLRSNRRRAFPRVTVEASAILRRHGRRIFANVCDISSLGARVRSKAKFHTGDRAVIELSGLPSIVAYVRWADGGDAGLAFETPIPMQIIAHWIGGGTRVFG